MGIFNSLKDLSDKFFEGLKVNAVRSAVKKTNEDPEVAKLQRKLDREFKEYQKLMKGSSETKPKKTARLKETFGEEFAKGILSNSLMLGMSYEAVIEIKGYPSKKVENATNGHLTMKLYFGEFKNRLKNKSYKFEVTLTDGKVVGWKDLNTISTGKGV